MSPVVTAGAASVESDEAALANVFTADDAAFLAEFCAEAGSPARLADMAECFTAGDAAALASLSVTERKAVEDAFGRLMAGDPQ